MSIIKALVFLEGGIAKIRLFDSLTRLNGDPTDALAILFKNRPTHFSCRIGEGRLSTLLSHSARALATAASGDMT